jgi:hypothetical protein
MNGPRVVDLRTDVVTVGVGQGAILTRVAELACVVLITAALDGLVAAELA